MWPHWSPLQRTSVSPPAASPDRRDDRAGALRGAGAPPVVTPGHRRPDLRCRGQCQPDPAVNVPAPRGLIVDRNNTVLVGNVVNNRSSSPGPKRPHTPMSSRRWRTGRADPAESPPRSRTPFQPVRAGAGVDQCASGHRPVPRRAPGPIPRGVGPRGDPAHLSRVQPVHVPSDPGCPGTTAPHVLGYVGDITRLGAGGPLRPELHRVQPDREVGDRVPVRTVSRGVDGSQALEVDAQGTVDRHLA